MTTAAQTTLVTLMSRSPGPGLQVGLAVPGVDGATAARLLIEDPAPALAGAWRRVTAGGAAPASVRIARIAAR